MHACCSRACACISKYAECAGAQTNIVCLTLQALLPCLPVSAAGISAELVDRFFAAQKAFFSLPLDDKMSIVADSNNRGYTPWHEETLNPGEAKGPDTHEGLYYGRELPADSDEAQLPLHGPNQVGRMSFATYLHSWRINASYHHPILCLLLFSPEAIP